MYNLIVYSGDDLVLEADFDKPEVTIGKGSEVDVLLKGWNISRMHAKLIMNDDDVFIEDCGSLFGTFVNEQRIVRHGPITNTDSITVAGYTISIISTIGNANAVVSNGGVDSFGSQNNDSVNRSFADHVGMPSPTAVVQTNAIPTGMPLRENKPNVTSAKLQTTDHARDRDKERNQIKTTHANANVVAQENTHIFGNSVNAELSEEELKAKPWLRPPSKRVQKVLTPAEAAFQKWRKYCHEAALHEMDVRRIDVNRMKDDDLRANVRLIIREVIESTPEIPKELDLRDLAKQVLDEAVGLGPLEPLLSDDNITEIMVNKFDEIWIERAGQLTLSTVSFTSDSAVLGAIERIVTPLGRRIDESSPMVDARLKDGSRVNAIIHPLAIRGPSVTIRKFSKKQITAADFMRFGSLNEDMVELLKTIVDLRLNIIISGGTGTGKTTFLNMVGNYVAQDERIVTVEDAAELKLTQPNLVSLESRPPNLEGKGAITIRDLVRNSLRMRPDRIMVGECRGGEALDMLQAMNTGHDGSMTTLHSNSPRDAMARLEVLVLMAGMNLPVRAIREQIASAVQIIVQLTRFSCGARKVTSITEIVGIEGEVIQLQEIYRFKKTGRDANDKTIGVFEYSGLKPDFLKRLEN